MKFDHQADPVLGGVLAHWVNIRGARSMPARRDLVLRDIRRLLPHVQLVDVADGGTRFQHRLVGTKLVEMFGEEYTKKYLDELLTGVRYELMASLYTDVSRFKRPIFLRNLYRVPRGIEIITNRIYLPLSNDSETVTMILCAITFDSPHSLAGEWRTALLERGYVDREEIDPDTLRPFTASVG